MNNSQVLFAALVLTVSSLHGSATARWNIQVEPVNSGEVILDPEFRVAIYENLLTELGKAKQFKSVFRSGDQNANGLTDLLVLKTTVEAYTPGSETRRAVTTVTGATKLKVQTQLCTRDGQVLIDRVVDGNVRFFGGNLRATHNLAHNLAEALSHAALPKAPAVSAQ
jgi:hypothetical protein